MSLKKRLFIAPDMGNIRRIPLIVDVIGPVPNISTEKEKRIIGNKSLRKNVITISSSLNGSLSSSFLPLSENSNPFLKELKKFLGSILTPNNRPANFIRESLASVLHISDMHSLTTFPILSLFEFFLFAKFFFLIFSSTESKN